MEPRKSLLRLKRLRDLRPKDNAFYSNLINFSEDHEAKCNIRDSKHLLLELSSLFRVPDSPSIYYYKKYQWKQRSLACKDIWKENLKIEVSKLSSSESQLINSMRESFMAAFSGANYRMKFSSLKARALASGILSLF